MMEDKTIKDYKLQINKKIINIGLSDQLFIVENSDNQFNFEVKNTTSDFDILELIKVAYEIDSNLNIFINDNISFKKNVFTASTILSNCIFNGTVTFRECTFEENVDFRNTKFNLSTSFNQTTFKKKVRFHHAEFREISEFENTKFNDLADFYDATFHNTQQFYLTDFLSVTIFSHTNFLKQIQFLYCKTSKESVISFENAVFKQSLDLSRANFFCKINFWEIKVVVLPNEFWLYENDNVEYMQVMKTTSSLKNLRETYRIIKDTFTKEGNHIEALKFYKNEMFVFVEEQNFEQKSKISEDVISLSFNKHSNNFGTSWAQGIKFTFLVTFFFYVVFLLTFSDKIKFTWTFHAFSETTKHFFEFLNITKWDIKPFGISEYNWGYIVLFIGRIFIGYGYYQIIQAFRKFGKN